MAADRLLTIRELAELLGVSDRWVMDHTASKDLPSYKVGIYRRFRESEIEAWLEKKRAA